MVLQTVTNLLDGDGAAAQTALSLPLPPARPEFSLNRMTVGIGVLCEKKRSVVVAADRMVTLTDRFNQSVQTDTDCIKIQKLLPNVFAVFTGGFRDSEAVFSRVSVVRGDSVLQVAEKVKGAFFEARQVNLDGQLRRVGSSLDAFGKQVLTLPQANPLTDLATKYSLIAQCLVAGVDVSGGHLYIADDAGTTKMDDPGFCAVGSGIITSQTPLLARAFHKGMTIAEGVFAAYESKRIAELAQGVGRQTDMVIIKNGKGKFLKRSVIDKLEKIYQKRIALPEEDRSAITRLLDE